MNIFRLRLLAVCTVLLALLAGNSGCGSSRSTSEAPEFSAIQTGSYIPRRVGKHEATGSSKRETDNAKRQKAQRKSDTAASREDDDYVPHGGFR